MRYKILLPFLLFSSLLSFAQNKPDKAYAVVGSSNGNFNWINIQEIDLSTGQLTRQIYEKEKTVFELVDGKTKKKLEPTENVSASATVSFKSAANQNEVKTMMVHTAKARYTTARNIAYEYPTAGMVAAAAYDQRHNKLFFTPMQFGELRWVDLYDNNSALKVFCLTDQLLTPKELQNETTQITRMVIAADGNGYALSNDANHFIRFTTAKTPVITQLGALKDDPSNDAVSVHTRAMYGGDMIADAFGGIYLFTANAAVFKIDLRSLTAKHLGVISGLPQHFTTNGAAVNNNGEIVVSSATSTDGYFKVDLTTLKAEKLEGANRPNSSDLATGNLLFERKKKELSNATLRDINLGMSNGKVSVFPNPVTQQFFNVDFKSTQAGQYDVQLADLSGKIIFNKRINVVISNQRENIAVEAGLAKGVYMLKILNGSKKLVSSGHIVLQ